MSANLNAPDHNWRTRGLCRDYPQHWTPDPPPGGASDHAKRRHLLLIRVVKKACLEQCEVIDQCRRDILTTPEGSWAVGIVAGMTVNERRSERSKLRKEVAA